MIKLKRLIIFTLLIFVFGLTVGCDTNTTTLETQQTTNTPTTLAPTTETPTTVSPTTAIPTTEVPTTEITTITISEETTATTENGYIGIEVTEVRKTEYQFNEVFDVDSITVIIKRASGQYLTLSKSMYTISGFSSLVEGEIEVTVTYSEFQDSFFVTILPYEGLEITEAYYLSAQGLTGNALFLELRDIINAGFVGISYGDARYILDETDRDPNNPNNVILVYLGTSVSGTWDDGITWNREHVWPQSLLGVSVENSTIGVGSDLQNLKPANPSVNSSRGNKYYDNATTSVSYEPRDEVKGDLARILLYMWTMYNYLELVDTYPSTYEMALLTVLLRVA